MKSSRHKGFTLLEVLISVSILGFIVAIGTQAVISGSQNESYLRIQNSLKTQSENMVFRLSKQLNQNRLILGNNSLGQAYRNALNLSGAPPVIPNSTLPTIRPTGALTPEKTCANSPNNFFRANAIGNQLLFVKYLERFSLGTLSNPNFKRQLDIYEFKFFYVTDDSNVVTTRSIDTWNNTPRNAQRLIEWTSVKYVDAQQLRAYLISLNSLSSGDVTEIRNQLTSKGINFAWDKNGTVLTGASQNTFYTVSGGGTTLGSIPDHIINMESFQDALTKPSQLSNEVIYSVAYNKELNKTSPRYFPTIMQVPKYYKEVVPECNGAQPASGTTPPLSTGNFPRGFEVGVSGPGSGRAVLLNISVVAKGGFKNLIEHGHAAVAYAKDL